MASTLDDEGEKEIIKTGKGRKKSGSLIFFFLNYKQEEGSAKIREQKVEHQCH